MNDSNKNINSDLLCKYKHLFKLRFASFNNAVNILLIIQDQND